MTVEDPSANLKLQIMKLSSTLKVVNDDNLNMKKRLSELWQDKQTLEHTINERNVQIQELKREYQQIEKYTASAEHAFSQNQELIKLQQNLKEQTHFVERISGALTRLLVSAQSIQPLPDTLKKNINELEDLLWNEGLTEQKVLVALIRSGGRLSLSELQAKCSLTSQEFEQALRSLRRSGDLTDAGTNIVELNAMKPAAIPSRQLGTLEIPEIFQHLREVLGVAGEDVTSITNSLMTLRDTLLLKGVSPRLGYQIESTARAVRSGSVTKEELLTTLSEWEDQAIS